MLVLVKDLEGNRLGVEGRGHRIEWVAVEEIPELNALARPSLGGVDTNPRGVDPASRLGARDPSHRRERYIEPSARLFFSDEIKGVDLSDIYGDKKRRKETVCGLLNILKGLNLFLFRWFALGRLLLYIFRLFLDLIYILIELRLFIKIRLLV